MDHSRKEEHILKDKDLPSKLFDNECIQRLNIDELSNVLKVEELKKPIELWALEFKNNFSPYFNEILRSSKDIDFRRKRCRDFNYHVKNIIDRISVIVQETSRANDVINGIKQYMENIFREKTPLVCSLDLDITEEKNIVKKNLDDFCENKDSFKKKLENYNHALCEKYKSYIHMTKISFNTYIEGGAIKDKEYLHINDKCNFDKRCAIFPIIQCYSNEIVVIESAESGENELCKLINEYPEIKGNSHTLKKIIFISSPIAGVVALSFAFYKFSPIGSWIHRGGNNFNTLQDGFNKRETKGFGGSPDFLNTSSDNSTYKIAYHTT
ncbi:PIR Superfamily Protein [Plasmodium ovale curtisi]|uniref:PIR Superfamily Protein n=1 Tax=Plasmodium ovale curtisi TaxID=864141 RepID=A0A1A8WPP5_PLAOA|nr:PIR Superfamily Protein [Plasmodium ovale curtisi]SBT01449.1 PIR Superfamily Protein [Plasmodium ovale curtisi]